MRNELQTERPPRRYVRVPGPFAGRRVGRLPTPVAVYELNEGGGFVNFQYDYPEEMVFVLRIELPGVDPLTLKAETVYRHLSGVAVRFFDLDDETCARLRRAIAGLSNRQSG